MPLTRGRLPAAVCATAAVALVLAGCGSERTIDAGKAARFLEGMTTAEGQVVSAHCPSGVKAKAGASFDCKVKLSGGASGTWTLDVVNKDGLVSASQSNLAVAGGPGAKASGRPVGSSAVQPAPGGGRVRVTLVAYQPHVAEPSGDALAKRVVGVMLRIQNVGRKPVSAKRPTYYAVLHDASSAGADEVPNARGPCGGAFYRSPIRLRPGKSAQGCIPYRVVETAAGAPVDFAFGLGAKNTVWALR